MQAEEETNKLKLWAENTASYEQESLMQLQFKQYNTDFYNAISFQQ